MQVIRGVGRHVGVHTKVRARPGTGVPGGGVCVSVLPCTPQMLSWFMNASVLVPSPRRRFWVTLEGNLNRLKGGTFDMVVPSEFLVNPFAEGYPLLTKTGRIQFDAWVCRRRGTSEVIDFIMLTFRCGPGGIGLPTKMSVLYCDSKKKCAE